MRSPFRSARWFTPAAALMAGVSVLLALASSLPFAVGLAVALGGTGASIAWRAREPGRPAVRPFFPALLALGVAVAFTSPSTTTNLLAGSAGIAFLYWVADDPLRAPGGSRRASPAIALCALAVGLALAIVLLGSGTHANLAVAGALLTVGVLLVAYLLARVPSLIPAPRTEPMSMDELLR